ncbi:MAG: hypothetical protein ABIH89_06415 [Elusimicrobiota bacterium]
MVVANEMKKVTEDIVGSFNERVKAIGDLTVDTQETLKKFKLDRKKMSKEQADDLAAFVDGLSKNVQNFLKEFQTEHKQMSIELTKDLGNFVGNMTDEVGNMIKSFQKEHKEMADFLKKGLAKGEVDRLKDFKDMMGSINESIKNIECDVSQKLKEFNEEHSDMSDALRKSLGKYVGGIVSDVKGFLGECDLDMKKAKEAWQGMSSVLNKARKEGVVPKIDAGKKTSEISKTVKKGRGVSKCAGTTKSGKNCKGKSVKGSKFCAVHKR